MTYTLQHYGPVLAISWRRRGCQEPVYLVTKMALVDEAYFWYTKRFRIETLLL